MANSDTKLEPMTFADYQTWHAACVIDYAKDKQMSLDISWDQAIALSTKSFEDILPDGLQTPDNYFFSLVGPEGRALCNLWIVLKVEWGKTAVFIYDITVAEGEKRKGYGEKTMQLLEDEARKLGATQIGLHVFGHNEAAKRLYLKMSYKVTDISMSKNI